MTDSRLPSSSDRSGCPTPEQWRMIESAESMTEIDPALDAHIENCPNCQARLERSLASDRLAFDAIVGDIDPIVRSRKALELPAGFELAGEPIHGGRGYVVKAREVAADRFVALKFPHAPGAVSRHDRVAFEAEAAAIRRLSHAHIVRLYELRLDHDPPALVMEWIGGGTLLERIETQPPNFEETVGLMIDLSSAVAHAHEKGILHRDIKPSNVMMAGPGYGAARLCDFGLAKFGKPDGGWSTATDFIGTPVYMAPEAFRNDTGSIGPQVDVYSLGAVMYRLLAGRLPFDGANPIALGIQVLHREPTPPKQLRREIPADLDTICTKCLRKDPDERYASAAALHADLERYRQGRAIHASRDVLFDKLRRWARRDPRAAIQAAGFVGGLMVTIVALATLLNRSRTSEKRAIENETRAIANERLATANGELARKNAVFAEKRLNESIRAMTLASPILKRFMHEYPLNPGEVRGIVEFATMRETLGIEPKGILERFKFHELTMEMADGISGAPGMKPKARELTRLGMEGLERLLEEHPDEVSKVIVGRSADGVYKETVRDKALVRIAQACLQLTATNLREERIGLGDNVDRPEECLELLAKAVRTSDLALEANPLMGEAFATKASAYHAIARIEIGRGQRNAAIAHVRESLSIMERLRLEDLAHPQYWIFESATRCTMAMMLMQPPADPAAALGEYRYLKSLMKDPLLNRNDSIVTESLRTKNKMQIWDYTHWGYMIPLGLDKPVEALEMVDAAIASFPVSEGSTNIDSVLRRRLDGLKLERLCLSRFKGATQSELEAMHDRLMSEFSAIEAAEQRETAIFYLLTYTPALSRRDLKRALESIPDVTKYPSLQASELERIRILLGITPVSETFEGPESMSKRRCIGNAFPMLKVMAETSRLIDQGKYDAARLRWKSIEAWRKEDNVVPAQYILVFSELKARIDAAR